jgi:hypothetical protein
MYTVTTTTHPKGDIKEFHNKYEAYEYASEIVAEGLEPLIHKGDEKFTWERFHALVQGWDC